MRAAAKNLQSPSPLIVRSNLRGVRALETALPGNTDSFPVCPALNQYHIVHVGLQEGTSPASIPRPQHTTCFLSCYHGKGRVRIAERWVTCESGSACVLPANSYHTFESLSGAAWAFCWVCYDRKLDQKSDLVSPQLANFESLPLQSAIMGLLHECNGPGQPGLIQKWTDLIHEYVSRFVQTEDHLDKLARLWERVSGHLAVPWSLEELARASGYSGEHLRRLCHTEMGRSPMQHVSYLRMRRASEMLTSTELTIESIAHEVGYENPFVFSNAFTKRMGWRPSQYRRKHGVPGRIIARAA